VSVFEYRALDKKGKNISGIIDAESSFSARQKLRASQIFPVSITEVDKGVSPENPPAFFQNVSVFNRISSSEILLYTRKLSTLVGSGFPLVSAIDALVCQTRSPIFKKKLAHIKNAIVEGNSFAGALAQHPEIFPPFYVNMVRAGESSGTLEIVLERLADMSERRQHLKHKIRTALAYPVLMLIIGLLVLFFLLTYIVPGITAIFDEMNQVLPVYTRILISISNFFRIYWWALVLLIFLGVGVFCFAKRTERGRNFIDVWLLKLPAVGLMIKKMAAARFSRTLGSLLENGVSMLPAMEIVKNIVGNVVITDVVDRAADSVGKGESLALALDHKGVFPLLCIQMIQVGEQSGELEKMLFKVADVLENEVESAIMSLTSLLEPLMIVFMGIIVGFIVLSICLPIFEMNQLVK
jgi:general secretion pathway protein F